MKLTCLIAAYLWDPNGTIIDLGFFALRYYSLFFALAFGVSYLVIKRQFSKHEVHPELLDKLTIYVFFGTLIGARLGHCLFYDLTYYAEHPLEIILPVSFNPHFHFTGFQGLASHGAGIGILLSIFLFCRKYNLSIRFVLDQVAIVVPLAGFFIRLGNLMNSEIIGIPSNLPWAFIFIKTDNIPRHPTQLYEAIAYLLIFILTYWLVRRYPKQNGYYVGLVLLLLFSFRIAVEFLKENQVAFEAGMLLDMGQILSIPFILISLILMHYKPHKFLS
ncbi:prolipoprotein diacylglyceryl transferase [Pedobacter sp. CAN_A7]|uniref:prolipoprotein diacylglyceryl transferase n=1 Tax=Pedobacter sp. CAN_A7 TaxID=2787722 RepID=UPI0018CBD67B